MRLSFSYHRRFEGVLPPRRTAETFFVLAPITVEIPDEDVRPRLVLEHLPDGMGVGVQYFGIPGRPGLFTKLNPARVEVPEGRGDRHVAAVANFNIGLGVPPTIEYRLQPFDRQGEPVDLLQPEPNCRKLAVMPRVRRILADYGPETEAELIEHFKKYIALPDGTVLIPEGEPYIGVELDRMLYTTAGVANCFGEPSRISYRLDEEARCLADIRAANEQAEALVDVALTSFAQWRIHDASYLRFDPERARLSWLAHRLVEQVSEYLPRLPTRQITTWATFRAFLNRWKMGWEGGSADLVREMHLVALDLHRLSFVDAKIMEEAIANGTKWIAEQADQEFAGLAP